MGANDIELRALLVGVQQRDEHAMRDFYKLVKPRLVAYIQRLVRDQTVAEEVLQDTLCHIWLHASLYQAERGALASWIYLIARSRALDALRRNRQATLAGPLEDYVARRPSNPNFESEPFVRSSYSQLRQYLQDLPPIYGRVIHLAYFEGYSHAEIASITNIPLGTVKSRMRIGLAKLRESLNCWQSTGAGV